MKSIPSSAPWRDSSAKESELAVAESIAALARGLRRAQGFTLFVAVCNKPAECDELIGLLAEAMPSVTFHHVRVSPQTNDLLAEVLAQAPERTGPVLITDIDRAVRWDRPRHPILETLNLQRPEWLRQVTQPVILWTPEPLLSLLAREAPDFLDWRSDTIHFPELSDEQVQLVREIALPWEATLRSLNAREERVAELRQRLAQTAHDTDRVAIAARGGWLLELARDSASLGRREEALQAAQEALDIYRRLAQDRPDAFLPYLATSLNNLGNRLSDLGRREEALQAAQEAVAIRRRLAQDRPDAFLPDLAMSLNNLGAMLSDLGRREEALQAAQEAVAIYRRLAQDRPDAFLPDLATSLNNLGNRLSDLGRREEALQAAQEAVAIYRRLAQDRPDAFLPDLARSLGVLGTCLVANVRLQDAVAAFVEGVRALSPAFTRLPRAFAPLMGALVSHYLTHIKELGESPDMELLAPILAKLEEIKGSEGESKE